MEIYSSRHWVVHGWVFKVHKKETRPFGSAWTEMMFVLHMAASLEMEKQFNYLFRDGSFRSIRLLIIICLLLDTTKINGWEIMVTSLRTPRMDTRKNVDQSCSLVNGEASKIYMLKGERHKLSSCQRETLTIAKLIIITVWRRTRRK